VNAPSTADIAIAIARSKREILADIASGRVPSTVATFSDLHDYVDANLYGGLCEEGTVWVDPTAEVTIEHAYDAANEVQNAVDLWLASGGHTNPFNGMTREALDEQLILTRIQLNDLYQGRRYRDAMAMTTYQDEVDYLRATIEQLRAATPVRS
jgi:hypothetical protein